jgi:hypothetical protein
MAMFRRSIPTSVLENHVLIQEFLKLSDKFYDRFTKRVAGLTDEEYLWEPADYCWSLRRGADGKLRMQWGLVFDEPEPVTTIAWRYTHISDLLSEERCARYVGLQPEPEDLFADGAPADASSARDRFEACFARWKRYVGAIDESAVYDKVGRVNPRHPDGTRAEFVLHILDEVIHHGAEIGVLRDLYRAPRLHDGDATALLRGADVPAEAIARLRGERPDLVLFAATMAEWDAIPRLIELGFGVDGRNGRNALHHAAAEGRADIVQLLLDAGADPDGKDPVYKVTPDVWAQFFGHDEIAETVRAARDG